VVLHIIQCGTNSMGMDPPKSRGAAPTPEQIRRFLDLTNRVMTHEAQLRPSHPHLCCFSDEERAKFPDPDVVKVMEWLKELSNG